MEKITDKLHIPFCDEFIKYLTHSNRIKLTNEDAQMYVKRLQDVNNCFRQNVVVDIYELDVGVIFDFKLYLYSKLSDNEANDCFKALKKYAKFIEQVVLTRELYPEQLESYFEGATMQVKVNRFERNPKARAACIAHHGLSCKVCDINFKNTYGSIGEDFIHVHHITPMSEIGKKYKVDPVKDLVPVCPNCHAMLHRRTPPYSVYELRNKLRNIMENI
ncbi:HNH endonuclease [Vibrio alginolyticus]|uniref:HNH endonuclease n=1 Tax=Vibrio TaxID=662 RepID=UPI00193DC19E|nr:MULTISPECIES: HNH endonuclease [Vibrio]MDW1808431.1 HNH endonuclease [Vibrio sp. Vb2362]MDW2259624.1 HNH endonuclease [Vibrio sp. 1409]ELU8564980.1 HNH endonuclease [Vibrio alginolyticus]MBM5038160.1 HNH endonuclease [Vibrio parahaemolyticus]MBM5056327.1 HNH endonuclease [Vibrio parahaemolyticus]